MRTAEIGFEGEVLRLSAFDPPGASYPSPRASNDPWFEHVALVARDIQAMWSGLEKAKPETVTTGAPSLLPPNTGSVTAFKFRDAEGHPLELISFPEGVGDPRWQQGGTGIRGFDHTAIVVTDLDRSLVFYTDLLGLRIGGRSLNQGREQDRLDGLIGCVVDVVALQPVDQPTPHLELLHYRSPPAAAPIPPPKANDVASVRQVHRVDHLDVLVSQLTSAGTPFVSHGLVVLGNGANGAAIRDPDGHMIVLLD
jgi:catechol 2,3-dioxygenase-like lactoylglutathione lyase family enzyme